MSKRKFQGNKIKGGNEQKQGNYKIKKCELFLKSVNISSDMLLMLFTGQTLPLQGFSLRKSTKKKWCVYFPSACSKDKQMHLSNNLTNNHFLSVSFCCFGKNLCRILRDSRRVKINSTKPPPWQKQASGEKCTQIIQNALAFPESSSQQRKFDKYVWVCTHSFLPMCTLTTTNPICSYKSWEIL